MNKRRNSAGAWLRSCLLLVAALLVTLAGSKVKAEAATEVKDFVLDAGNAYMTGICKQGAKPSGDIVIPETFTYDGVKYKVTAIGEAAFGDERGGANITSVTIPSSVTFIGRCAFYNCKKLKTVTISKKAKLSSIAYGAFLDCTSLKEIYINAETVGDDAFNGCSSLTKVSFGDRVKEIGDRAFGYTALKNITFGNNITTIGDNVLEGCSKLEKIVVGEKVTSLGGSITWQCYNIKSITVKSTKLKAENCGKWSIAPFCFLSDSVATKVPEGKTEEYGFLWTNDWADASGYVNIAFSSDYAYMAGMCKKGETLSGDVVVPETFTCDGVNYRVVAIGVSAFEGNEITSVQLPATVKEIDVSAFKNCSKLKTVTIPESAELRSIGELAFNNCTSLRKIYINAETVGWSAFSDCTSLTKVTFGDNVKEIGDWAFENTGIKSITFGKNITTIGELAVSNCAKLTEITIGSKVTSLGRQIDWNCKKLKKVTINSKKLTSANCGETLLPAFCNDSGKVTITVPKSKLAAYKKFLADKSATIKS